MERHVVAKAQRSLRPEFNARITPGPDVLGVNSPSVRLERLLTKARSCRIVRTWHAHFMDNRLSQLLAGLAPDPWRETHPFTPEIAEASGLILAEAQNGVAGEKRQARVLNDWIAKYQPCLFGKAAASRNKLAFCLINESDIEAGDEHVRAKIQEKRRAWRRRASSGGESGFVSLTVSERIAFAIPDRTVASMAKYLCELYLRMDAAEFETIYHEQLFLDVPGWGGDRRMWLAGVNYFNAQGDGRWWRDHRIPAGMAFSVNSVGHLMATGNIDRLMDAIEEAYPPAESDSALQVRSPEDALRMAMKTIQGASDGVSGRATELIPLSGTEAALLPRCPVSPLSGSLAGMNHCTYQGYYHTDQTLPADYFQPGEERPHDAQPHTLDFTYLFVNEMDNPAFETMSAGIPVRSADEKQIQAKNLRMEGTRVTREISDGIIKGDENS